MMPTRTTIAALLLVACCQSATQAQRGSDPAIQAVLNQVIATADQSTNRVPGIVAGIQRHNQPMRIAAAGVRKWGDETAITTTDQLHIGSCTKAMTATLIAKLVDQGKLTWETTLPQALPNLSQPIHDDFKDATVRDLLAHRSGLRANADNWWAENGKPVRQQRETIAAKYLSKPAKQKRGTYLYSNLGYMVAGLIVERITDKRWEDAMRDELFKPLGIRNAGFGSPGTPGKVDQPWGHRSGLKPAQRDNAPALGPAGTVHLPLTEWAKFSQLHCGGPSNKLLSPESLKALHQPDGRGANGSYALGWITAERPWGKGTVLTHSGSNTWWFSTVWVAPNTQTSYLVATNDAGPKVRQIADQVIGALIQIDNGAPAPKIMLSMPVSAKLSPQELQSLVGEYDYGRLGKLVVKQEGAKLMAQLTGQPFLQVVATSKNELSWVDIDAQLRFKRDKSGKILAVNHHQSGQTLPVKKVK